MASALSENPASVIHSLNLAHNTLDNQGTRLCELYMCPIASYIFFSFALKEFKINLYLCAILISVCCLLFLIYQNFGVIFGFTPILSSCYS